MYLFAGGKESSIDVATFLPGWWNLSEEEDQTTEGQLRAKLATAFAAFGGTDTSGSS